MNIASDSASNPLMKNITPLEQKLQTLSKASYLILDSSSGELVGANWMTVCIQMIKGLFGYNNYSATRLIEIKVIELLSLSHNENVFTPDNITLIHEIARNVGLTPNNEKSALSHAELKNVVDAISLKVLANKPMTRSHHHLATGFCKKYMSELLQYNEVVIKSLLIFSELKTKLNQTKKKSSSEEKKETSEQKTSQQNSTLVTGEEKKLIKKLSSKGQTNSETHHVTLLKTPKQNVTVSEQLDPAILKLKVEKLINKLIKHSPVDLVNDTIDHVSRFFAILMGKQLPIRAEQSLIEKWILKNILLTAEGLPEAEVATRLEQLQVGNFAIAVGTKNAFIMLCRAYQLSYQLTAFGTESERELSKVSTQLFKELISRFVEKFPHESSFRSIKTAHFDVSAVHPEFNKALIARETLTKQTPKIKIVALGIMALLFGAVGINKCFPSSNFEESEDSDFASKILMNRQLSLSQLNFPLSTLNPNSSTASLNLTDLAVCPDVSSSEANAVPSIYAHSLWTDKPIQNQTEESCLLPFENRVVVPMNVPVDVLQEINEVMQDVSSTALTIAPHHNQKVEIKKESKSEKTIRVPAAVFLGEVKLSGHSTNPAGYSKEIALAPHYNLVSVQQLQNDNQAAKKVKEPVPAPTPQNIFLEYLNQSLQEEACDSPEQMSTFDLRASGFSPVNFNSSGVSSVPTSSYLVPSLESFGITPVKEAEHQNVSLASFIPYPARVEQRESASSQPETSSPINYSQWGLWGTILGVAYLAKNALTTKSDSVPTDQIKEEEMNVVAESPRVQLSKEQRKQIKEKAANAAKKLRRLQRKEAAEAQALLAATKPVSPVIAPSPVVNRSVVSNQAASVKAIAPVFVAKPAAASSAAPVKISIVNPVVTTASTVASKIPLIKTKGIAQAVVAASVSIPLQKVKPVPTSALTAKVGLAMPPKAKASASVKVDEQVQAKAFIPAKKEDKGQNKISATAISKPSAQSLAAAIAKEAVSKKSALLSRPVTVIQTNAEAVFSEAAASSDSASPAVVSASAASVSESVSTAAAAASFVIGSPRSSFVPVRETTEDSVVSTPERARTRAQHVTTRRARSVHVSSERLITPPARDLGILPRLDLNAPDMQEARAANGVASIASPTEVGSHSGSSRSLSMRSPSVSSTLPSYTPTPIVGEEDQRRLIRSASVDLSAMATLSNLGGLPSTHLRQMSDPYMPIQNDRSSAAPSPVVGSGQMSEWLRDGQSPLPSMPNSVAPSVANSRAHSRRGSVSESAVESSASASAAAAGPNRKRLSLLPNFIRTALISSGPVITYPKNINPLVLKSLQRMDNNQEELTEYEIEKFSIEVKAKYKINYVNEFCQINGQKGINKFTFTELSTKIDAIVASIDPALPVIIPVRFDNKGIDKNSFAVLVSINGQLEFYDTKIEMGERLHCSMHKFLAKDSDGSSASFRRVINYLAEKLGVSVGNIYECERLEQEDNSNSGVLILKRAYELVSGKFKIGDFGPHRPSLKTLGACRKGIKSIMYPQYMIYEKKPDGSSAASSSASTPASSVPVTPNFGPQPHFNRTKRMSLTAAFHK